jgi:hypothetical protein
VETQNMKMGTKKSPFIPMKMVFRLTRQGN